MKLKFLGAARKVTGSMFLFEPFPDIRILVDCGFDMDDRSRNYTDDAFDFNPRSLTAVVLTHAHIDHSGNLPALIRLGYEGPIYCTLPTLHLSRLLLHDSAMLQSKRTGTGKKLRKGRKKQDLSGIFEKEVDETLGQMKAIPFKERRKIASGVWFTLNPTGHLPGAANIIFEVDTPEGLRKVAFTGDIGRNNYPLLPDPEPIPQVDYLICESTYGNRLHTPIEETAARLEKVIYDTCVQKSGRLIIPAFSVGRTQAMLFILDKLFIEGRLPKIKIFVDSPMAIDSIRAYERFIDYLSEEAKAHHRKHGRLFDNENLILVERAGQSKAIAHYHEPCVIISASGMLEGGRIQEHVRANLSNAYATILMVGFCSEGTLGHTLLQQPRALEFNGKQYAVLAEIDKLDSLSGHADQQGLVDFVASQSTSHLKKIWLVHGELDSQEELARVLAEKGYEVAIPEQGESAWLS